MKRFLKFSIFILAILSSPIVSAQFYESGRPSGFRRWRTIGDDTTKVIFSKGSEAVAERAFGYMQAERGRFATGYKYPALEMPLVIWSGTALSNGLAMQAPRRIEFVAMPSVGSYSEPWLWQLAVHEGRHSALYGNLNRSTVKALSYVFGEQVEMLAMGLMSFWLLEGDAVLHETKSSEWGRGEQPSFSMHYRALGDEILKGGNVDKWFSGSYNDFVPDHYQLGYQLVKYIDKETGKSLANDVAEYTSKYPFAVFTTQLALKKHYGMYTPELFRRTFTSFVEELKNLDIPAENSAKSVTDEPKRYTTYSYPQFLNDTTIVALKSDFDDFSRFVTIDTRTGAERFIRHTGYVSTRPELKNGELVWSEARRDYVWDGEYDSRIVAMNVDGTKLRQVTGQSPDMFMFPTFEGDKHAYLKYNQNGGYSLLYSKGEWILSGVEKSYHGLAWDNASGSFYLIALTDEGMYIEEFNPTTNQVHPVTQPAKITLSDLRANDGVLTFGSVENGTDEIYALNLSDGSKHRLTTSRYGAFNTSGVRNGAVALTTYSKKGYGVAVQNVKEEIIAQVESSKFKIESDTIENPLLVVNETDTALLAENSTEQSVINSKRYSKLGHLFRAHSWMPLDVDYNGIMNNGMLTMPNIGATLLSQNTLGTSFTQLNYGYDMNLDRHLVRGSWRYEGFIPKIELSATWTNVPQGIFWRGNNERIPSSELERNNYSLDLSALVYIPFVVSDGYRRTTITPIIQYNFNNTKIYYHNKTRGYVYDYNTTFAFQLRYSDYVKMTYRNLYPKWGYSVHVGFIGDTPLGKYLFAAVVYGKAYMPGILRNHSLSLEIAYQNAQSGKSVDQTLPRIPPDTMVLIVIFFCNYQLIE